MRRPNSACVLFAPACLLLAAGCQSEFAHVIARADDTLLPRLVEQAVLVAAVDDQATATTASVPTTQPTTAPNGKPRYTAPGATFQKVGVLVALATPGSVPGVAGTGKEAAESRISSTAIGSGAPALGAPQPRTLGAVVGQPGLQRGFASGLGFARPPTIFTPRANPLTGSTGRCGELVRTGFFPNDAACRAFFKR